VGQLGDLGAFGVIDDTESRVRAAVDELRRQGAPVDVVDCDPALADTAEFCAAYGYALDDSANAIVVIGKSDPPVYAMCVVLASTRLDVNRTVRRRLGTKKASFAPPDVTAAITGMTMGGVTPFGRPAGLPLWVDALVMSRERIVVGGGSRSCKVVGPPSMLLAAGGEVAVVDELATAFET
jgi:prolyl-tRNA editing enzyme YbaK/EbsC (Cys-tRNA(Pro) deacylase)